MPTGKKILHALCDGTALLVLSYQLITEKHQEQLDKNAVVNRL